MKTIFNTLVLAVLFAVAPNLCFAAWSFGPVSKERAKELGMEIRSKANEVSVELEIKTEGELKILSREDLSRVELQIKEGETRVVSATLKEDRSKSGRVVVGFAVNRAHLDMITLRVWVYQGLGGVIHELRLQDFVELEKVR